MELFKGIWELFCSDESTLNFIVKMAYVLLIAILMAKYLLCIDMEEHLRIMTFLSSSVMMFLFGWFFYYFLIFIGYMSSSTTCNCLLIVMGAYVFFVLIYETVTLIIDVVQEIKGSRR